MIKIENLTVAFDGKEAVKNINLELKEGEILGVVGESGSGKSVTALTLMGLDKEDARVISGKITFRGEVLLEELGKRAALARCPHLQPLCWWVSEHPHVWLFRHWEGFIQPGGLPWWLRR